MALHRARSPWLTFAVTSIAAMITALDVSIVNVAFVEIQRSFPRSSQGDVSWVVTAYAIAFAALLVVGGRTADRVGRRRVFLIGIVGFTLSSIVCARAGSIGVLIGARGFQGAFAAVLAPSTLGLLLPAFPPERRTHIVSLWGGMSAIGVALGPTVGALLIQHHGWRWAFYVNIPICAAAFLGGLLFVAETPREVTARTPDYLGAALITIALAALTLAIEQGTDWGWIDGRTVAAFAVAVVLAPMLVRRCATHPVPIVDLSLFRARSFSLSSLALLSFNLGFGAAILMNVLFLRTVWDYSILKAGLLTCWGPITVALVSGKAGRMATRIGFRSVVLFGLCTYGSGIALLMIIAGMDPSPWLWVPCMFVVGLGLGCTFPVLSAAYVSELAPDRYSTGSAVNTTGRQMGQVVGIAILVAILGGRTDVATYRHGWLYVIGCVAASAVFASRLRGGARAAAPEAPLAAAAPGGTRP